ncbi:hypothetical protein [Bacillus cereus]|uniref:hypothetical protein n=1 Tax=Bacillus cereus TaxID=1396 RepID=UPI0027D251BB|nr:hypothetical protein [Bacillus cereus]
MLHQINHGQLIGKDALGMKLKRFKKDGSVRKLIEEGRMKYYKPEGKQRGDWSLTVEAMNKSNGMD